ncbi:MAG TPA: nitroreductase [Actinomycetota bacterium]|nr:nitroreductase [Actinomycetota bacterium]
MRSRRSMPVMTERRPSRADVEGLLESATMAPTHHMTQPWRFIVLSGAARESLGSAMGERVRRESAGDPHLEEKVRAEAARPLRAPVVIAVVYTPSDHPKAVATEDRSSVGAAMQNILLAAHARGLATYLRTGPASLDPGVSAHLGLKPGPPPEEIAGFIYLGYAAQDPPPPKARTSASDLTEWRGWDQD